MLRLTGWLILLRGVLKSEFEGFIQGLEEHLRALISNEIEELKECSW